MCITSFLLVTTFYFSHHTNEFGLLRRSQIDFSLRCMFPKWRDWNIEYTPKGLRKLQLQQAIRIIGLVLALYTAYSIRHDFRGGVLEIRRMAVDLVRRGLHSALAVLDGGVKRVVG